MSETGDSDVPEGEGTRSLSGGTRLVRRSKPGFRHLVALLAVLMLGSVFVAVSPAAADVLPDRAEEGTRKCKRFRDVESYGPYPISVDMRICWKIVCEPDFCKVRVCIKNMSASYRPRFMRLELDHVGSDPNRWNEKYLGQNVDGQRLCRASKRGIRRIYVDACQVSLGRPSVCGSDSWWAPSL